MSNPSPLPRFQFSLRWLLAVVTLLAIVLGTATVVGGTLVSLLTVTLYVLYPVPLAMAAIYSRGDIRAFSIGALIPWVAVWPQGPPQSADLANFLGFVVWLLLFGGSCGFVAATTRRWIERQGSSGGK